VHGGEQRSVADRY